MLLNTPKLLKYAPLKCAVESVIILPFMHQLLVLFVCAPVYLFYCPIFLCSLLCTNFCTSVFIFCPILIRWSLRRCFFVNCVNCHYFIITWTLYYFLHDWLELYMLIIKKSESNHLLVLYLII